MRIYRDFKIHDFVGLVLSIDNQIESPLINSKLIFLDYGKQHFVWMTKTVTKSLPSPYGDCVSPDTYISHFQADFEQNKLKYTKSNCILFCMQYDVKNSCRCYAISLPSISNAKPCLSRDSLMCSFSALYAFNLNKGCNSVCSSSSMVKKFFFSKLC